MKNFIILCCLLLLACKSEPKTETQIDKSVYDMWRSYAEANSTVEEDELPEAWYFHNNKEDADRLAELTLQRKKQASSGLYRWYQEAGAELPKIGTKHIITDFEGKARAIIEITQVDTIPFNEISEAYAILDMGTTVAPLEKWKKAHWDFFEGVLKQNGQQASAEMLVVCERFKTVWPNK